MIRKLSLWEEFDAWYEKRSEPIKCDKCNRWEFPEVDWDMQKRKITELFKKHMGSA